MKRGGSWADTLVAGVTIKPSSVRFRTITRHNNYHIISTSNLDIDPVGLHLTGDVAEEKSGMELELGRGEGGGGRLGGRRVMVIFNIHVFMPINMRKQFILVTCNSMIKSLAGCE